MQPAATAIIDLKTQRFDMTSKVMDHILPYASRFEHLSPLGEAECFANQATVHVP